MACPRQPRGSPGPRDHSSGHTQWGAWGFGAGAPVQGEVLGTEGWGQERTPGRRTCGGTCAPSQLDLVPGTGAAARNHGERAPPAGVRSPLRLWEPPLSATLSSLYVQGLRFLPRRPAGPPAPGGGRWPPDPGVPAPSPPGPATCSRGRPLLLLWPSPGGLGGAPALCTAPPVQEQEPDPGPCPCEPQSPASPSHALPPFLHCLPKIPVGLPLPCLRLHTCPLLPPATTLCMAISASCPHPSRPSGTLTSGVVKVGSGPHALMPVRAARATPVQPEAASEAAFQACGGHSFLGGRPRCACRDH